MKEWSGGFPNDFPPGMEEGNAKPVSEQGQAGYICYVDDSKTSAYVTRKILKDQHFQVDHFSSAEPAIVALLQKDYDLLVTDLTLETGGMDGDELLRFLRRSGHPGKKALPVILITGHTDKDTLLRLYESGANAVLTKPIAGDNLMEKVRSLVPERPRDWNPPTGAPEVEPTPTPRPAPTPRNKPQAMTPAGQTRSTAARRILMQQAAYRKNLSGTSTEGVHRAPPQAQAPSVRPLRSDGRRRPVPSPQAPPVRPVNRPPEPPVELNPFAEAKSQRGGGFSQTLGGAVKSAMEAARQKLTDRGARSIAPVEDKPLEQKKAVNDAAALIARLREQKKAAGADAEQIPTLQESTPPRRQAKRPAEDLAPEQTPVDSKHAEAEVAAAETVNTAAPKESPAEQAQAEIRQARQAAQTPAAEDSAAAEPIAAEPVAAEPALADVAAGPVAQEPAAAEPAAEKPAAPVSEAAASTGSENESAAAGKDRASNFGIVSGTDVDLDNLFSGLVPEQNKTDDTVAKAAASQAAAAEQAAAEQAATEARAEEEPAARDDGDSRRMITALDVGTDLVNAQDSFYEDSRYSLVRMDLGRVFSGPVLGTLWEKVLEYKIIIAAIILAALLIFSNFSNVLTGGKTVEVETVRVGLGSIHQSLTVPGKVVSNMKVDVSSSSPGKIVTMKIKEGALVKKGDVLAEIENEQAVSDVKRAEGNLQSAREETALAEKTWKRMRHAFGLGAVSRFAVEEAEAALKTAKARQAVALEEVRSSRLALNKLTVNAPFDGTITVRHAQLGQWVSPSEPLFTLVDMSKREVELMVDTADSGLIRSGQSVSLSSDAYAGKQWLEKVTRIGTATNRSNMTNTVSVFVSLSNGAPDLRIGQQVDAEIRTSSSSNIIKLPIEALITRNGSTWVAVVNDGRVHFSPVVIGVEDFTHAEVLEGVQPRQEVIIPRDASSLQEGDLVRVLATRTVE